MSNHKQTTQIEKKFGMSKNFPCPPCGGLATQERKRDLKLWNRMKLCALSIFLLWISSLKIATYIASHAISVPPIQTLYNSCKSVLQVTRQEKQKFESCANTQITQCMLALDLVTSKEMNRVQLASQHNSQQVDALLKIKELCIADYANFKDALEKLTTFQPTSIPFKTETCSTDEQENLLNSLISVDTYKSEAFLIAENYEQNSKNTIKSLVDYAKIRAEYDRNYIATHIAQSKKFFDHHLPLQPLNISGEIDNVMESVEQWVGCMSLSNNSSCILKDGMISSFELINSFHEQTKEKVTLFLEETSDAYKKKYDLIVEMNNDIMNKAQKWVKFFKDMKSVIEYVNRQLPKRRSGGWFDISIEDIIPPEFIGELNLFQSKISAPQELLDAANKIYDEQIQARAVQAYDQISGFISGNISAITEGYENWMNEIKTTFNFEKVNFFQDYDPPKYIGTSINATNLEDERNMFLEKSEIFMSNLIRTIENVANASSSMEDDENRNMTIMAEINKTSTRAKVRNFKLKFEDLSSPTIDFDLWIFDIISVRDVFIVADVILRIYLSLRICFKYWSVSSVKLPDVDIRIQNDFIPNPLEWNNGKLLIVLISNPVTGLLLLSIVISWIVTLTTSVYLPVIMDYRSGCIPNAGNGTFISENLYSLTYNYAYNKGSSDIVRGTEKFAALRIDTCSEQALVSSSKYDDDIAQMTRNSNLISSLNNHMTTFENCINMEHLDRIFSELCCNFPGYDTCSLKEETVGSTNHDLDCPMKDVSPPVPFELPSNYINPKSCNIGHNGWESFHILDSVFDCSKLPSCDITCEGPHKAKLRKVTKECSCTGEWLFHSYWLRNILSFLIYILLNLSRVLFIDGLSRVLWRHLHPGGFTFWANCNIYGEIITQEKGCICEERKYHNNKGETLGKKLDKIIKKQIRRNSLKFKMTGFMMILGSISMNGIWIAIVLSVNDDLRLVWM